MASSIRKTVLKRVDDAIWTSFAEAYQKAHDYYDNDQLDECIKECSDILGEGAVPRYIKISTLILLALVVESEADFRAARSEAGKLEPVLGFRLRIFLTTSRKSLPHDHLVSPYG